MLVVTTNDIPGWEIQRVCGEVFGLTVRSRNAFSQFGAGFKSMFGGELQGMTKNLAESRNEAMARLINEARNKGGNAIVAMRFDTTEIGDVWTEICAYGTAVQAVPVTDAARYTASQLGYGGAPQPQRCSSRIRSSCNHTGTTRGGTSSHGDTEPTRKPVRGAAVGQSTAGLWTNSTPAESAGSAAGVSVAARLPAAVSLPCQPAVSATRLSLAGLRS